jgi:hypothetical protein
VQAYYATERGARARGEYQRRLTDSGAGAAKQKAWRDANIAHARKREGEWRERNREKINARNRERQKTQGGQARNRAKVASYRAAQAAATPAWADLVEIARIYAALPEGHHVDHVVPIRGKSVCGLHVENNLQYLSALENSVKQNQFNCDCAVCAG